MAIASVDDGDRQCVFDDISVRTSNPLNIQLSVA